jgi:hypothetical protein
MAKRTVTVCDICGAILEEPCLLGPVVVGSTNDGHRNEEDTAAVELCHEHYRKLRAAVDVVAGVDAHGTTRTFGRDQAEAVIVLLVRRWGAVLQTIETAGGKA